MNKIAITQQIEQEFAYIDSLISAHTNSAIVKINAEAMQTYWEIGQYISDRLKSSQWRAKVVGELADYLKRQNPKHRKATLADGLFYHSEYKGRINYS